MKNNLVYSKVFSILKRSHNKPVDIAVSDLVEELETLDAMPKDTIWQIKLALMHYDQDQMT